MRGKTRITGKLVRPGGPLTGSTVSIVRRGKKTVIETDENGEFEVFGLAPGKYRIAPDNIEGMTNTTGRYVDVRLKKGGTVIQNFVFTPR